MRVTSGGIIINFNRWGTSTSMEGHLFSHFLVLASVVIVGIQNSQQLMRSLNVRVYPGGVSTYDQFQNFIENISRLKSRAPRLPVQISIFFKTVIHSFTFQKLCATSSGEDRARSKRKLLRNVPSLPLPQPAQTVLLVPV